MKEVMLGMVVELVLKVEMIWMMVIVLRLSSNQHLPKWLRVTMRTTTK